MLITSYNQLYQKSLRASQIQPSFLARLTRFTFFQTTNSLDVKSYTPVFQMQKESNPSKHPWKIILNETLRLKKLLDS